MTSADEYKGLFLIGVFFAILLYGVNLTQSYVFWLNRENDPVHLRYVVLAVVLLETANTAFIMHLTYYITIFSSSLRLIWSVSHTVVVLLRLTSRVRPRTLRSSGLCILSGVLAIAIVQSKQAQQTPGSNPCVFFCFLKELPDHTQVCSSSWYSWWHALGLGLVRTLSPSLLCMNHAHYATIKGSASRACMLSITTELFTDTTFRIALISGISLSAATDVVIAVILIYLLWTSRTGIKQSDRLVETVMAYVVETGAVTANPGWAPLQQYACIGFAGLSFATYKRMTSVAFPSLSLTPQDSVCECIPGFFEFKGALTPILSQETNAQQFWLVSCRRNKSAVNYGKDVPILRGPLLKELKKLGKTDCKAGFYPTSGRPEAWEQYFLPSLEYVAVACTIPLRLTVKESFALH
ncbi:hypothetical protein NLI96_g6487 [Meripilus lineatus]|uniref:DUF6534 domain-containing protein n=1 Tax=Meripilus lineatus TaxID=2056292 RepID=A0AAD5V3B1_9APHY|nr:hypothetical protein NLI96_g6487 [Physisporinus lineatus]